MFVTKELGWGTIDFHSRKKKSMKVTHLFSSKHYSEYLLVCSTEERNSYKFGTT